MQLVTTIFGTFQLALWSNKRSFSKMRSTREVNDLTNKSRVKASFISWQRKQQYVKLKHVDYALDIFTSMSRVCNAIWRHFFATIFIFFFQGRMHCFSTQVVINRCFLLNSWKKTWRKSVLSFSRKTQNAHLILQN